MNFLLVGMGGFLGATARYGVYLLTRAYLPEGFPYGTFLINVSGCFLAGLVLHSIEKAATIDRSLSFFCMMGFLGAYTTFSALEVEAFTMIREGHAFLVFSNFALQLSLGFGAVWLGHALAAR